MLAQGADGPDQGLGGGGGGGGGDDPFDFDLSSQDMKIIEEQETQFVTQQRSADAPADLQRRLLACVGELEGARRERTVKEGEVSMLRERLGRVEAEKYEASRRHAARLDALEQERHALVQHWLRENERLETELRFKQHEERASLSRSPPAGQPLARGFSGAFRDLVAPPQTHPKRTKTADPAPRRDACCEAGLLAGDPAGGLSHRVGEGDLLVRIGAGWAVMGIGAAFYVSWLRRAHLGYALRGRL